MVTNEKINATALEHGFDDSDSPISRIVVSKDDLIDPAALIEDRLDLFANEALAVVGAQGNGDSQGPCLFVQGARLQGSCLLPRFLSAYWGESFRVLGAE